MSSISLTEEIKTKLVRFTDFEIVSDDSYQYKLMCFDVDAEGNYALGFGSSRNRAYVYVYNNACEFICGCSFNTNGSHGIELCNEGIKIFHGREDVVLTYTWDGMCIDAQNLILNTSNQYTLRSNFLRKTRETIDGRTYSMQRDVNIGESYSRFVVTDADGTETILYGDSSSHVGEIILIVFGILFLIVGAILTFKKYEYECEDNKYQ